MKFIELFAGIGGFRYGLARVQFKDKDLCQSASTTGNTPGQCEQLNNISTKGLPYYECVYANEWDKYAANIYEKNFGERPDTRSITDVDVSDIPDHDLLVGGFPCQAFSIAGKRRGFADTRGTLFFEIARILKAKRPRYCLLENVKGLLSHEGGRTFQIILQTLDELGYDLQWQVLNSKDFGVPQNRERVFIIGHIRGERRPEVFPIRNNDNKANDVQGQISNTITARYEGAQATGTYIGENKFNAQIKQLNQPTHSNDRIYGEEGISPSLNTMQGGRRQPQVMMNTLTEATGNRAGSSKEFIRSIDNIHKAIGQIRRLTPTECERLQGFPDGWTESISDTQRYKCLGNAVTTNVITAIGERLI